MPSAIVTPLQWDVLVTKREGVTRDVPPGKEQWMWVPTSATLIDDAHTCAARLAASRC